MNPRSASSGAPRRQQLHRGSAWKREGGVGVSVARSTSFIVALVAGLALPQINQALAQYVHPTGPPPTDSFQRPSADDVRRWAGPYIHQVNVRCWYAQPTAPEKPIGGAKGIQKVSQFFPLQSGTEIDTSYQQTKLLTFSGGGMSLGMEPREMPRGVFVSFRGHPVWSVTKIEYPTRGISFSTPGKTAAGIKISLDFIHEPTMGECGLYAAVWLAQK